MKYKNSLDVPFNHLIGEPNAPAHALHPIEIEAFTALVLHNLAADWDTTYPLKTIGKCKVCFTQRCTQIRHVNGNVNDWDTENLIGICAGCAKGCAPRCAQHNRYIESVREMIKEKNETAD